ncbi:uncharacterized protein LOC118739913, partial [Rhagoletis pomonella]|uniref:uncharacterized protein LOC118739913 n=1 Tax=Rhagoletis pomonella TaxID=28610 RepID=UPI0017872D13
MNMPLSKEAIAKLIFNFSANSRKAGKQKKTKGFLIARRNLLVDYCQKYNALRDDISSMDASADEAAVKKALSEERYTAIESAYCDALGELHDEIEEMSHNVNDSQRLTGNAMPALNSTLPGQISTPKSILPKIELPKFDGSFQKWLCFKDLFFTCIVQDSSLSNVQRMHYLKGSLQGEAEAMLRNLNVMEDNFQIAWDMLQKRYDNKRRMVKSYLCNILKLTPVQTESDVNLRKLLDNVTESVRALKQLGRPTNHWDDWLVFLVTEKLDPVTVKDWEMSLASSDVLPEYDALTSFLEKRIQGLEAMVAVTKVKPKESAPKPPQHAAIRSHQTSLGRCPCCAGKHALMYCSEFRRKTPSAKLDVVTNFKLCRNCLKARHTASDCASTYACQKCMQKHHTILHDSLSSLSSTTSPRLTCTNSMAQQKPIDATTATLAQHFALIIPKSQYT